MEHWKLENWCFEAVEKIKYRPDRDAVYTELLQHLDDRCESFIAQGMSKDEAVKKTVEVMGDAGELAVQLAAIHRPFWGFAYSISKWLMRIAAVITAVALIGSIVKYLKSPATISEGYTNAESVNSLTLLSVKPDCSDSSDGYTFRVTQAEISQREYIFSNGAEETWIYLLISVKVTALNPFALPCNALESFQGTDNRGLHYSNVRYLEATTKRPFSNEYLFKIQLEEYEELTWFELSYREAGRDIVLHIDLTGGGET